MKKLISALSFILLLGMLFSCGEKIIGDPIPYTSYDIEQVKSDWKEARESTGDIGLKKDLIDPNNPDELVIPHLSVEGFVFYSLEVNEYQYIYRFVREGTNGPSHSISKNDEIFVHVQKHRAGDSFRVQCEQIEAVGYNGLVAYSKNHNVWIRNNDGEAISVHFPDGIKISKAADFYDTVTFERYTGE